MAVAAKPMGMSPRVAPSSSRRTRALSTASEPGPPAEKKEERKKRVLSVARRGALLLTATATLTVPRRALAIAEKPVEVANYLEAAKGVEGFYEFVPNDRETPAIRAGTIGKYRFAMPGTWIRRTVANILSGNYCQPRCDEPWTEVLFQGPKEGSLQVIVSPLNKLSRRSLSEGESIDAVGTLDGIINALGPNITGNTIEEEEVTKAEAKQIDGVTYYWYTLDTPYAKTGQHQVASIAAKENAVFVLAVSATDKQWAQNSKKLKTIQESFRV